jgi:hypothetical protein
MKDVLAQFHLDFAYHEEPGMGHWWGKEGIPGTACVDWPPMWEFFRNRTGRQAETIRDIEFTTVNPGVSAWSHWVGIEAQIRQLAPSTVRIHYDAEQCVISGSTDNVARLAIATKHFEKGKTLSIVIDDQELPQLKWDGDKEDAIWLTRESDKWLVVPRPAAMLKGPHRYGTFKDAFRNRVLFVYGTGGTLEENSWSLAKARYDAEQFWYRGNGSIELISDAEFIAREEKQPASYRDRNLILYGHADSNRAWEQLLEHSPIQVRRGRVAIGERAKSGDDLGCLFVRPRPGSDRAMVGVVAGTGTAGMRLTDRLPYFVSGVAYPDCIVLDSQAQLRGTEGIRVAGFFGLDWSVARGEFVWND